ncbi:MAG: TerD family protein [Polyangiales bacterium]
MIVDDKSIRRKLTVNRETFKYEFDEEFATATAVEFGRFYHRGDTWRFEAMGQDHQRELGTFVNQYVG